MDSGFQFTVHDKVFSSSLRLGRTSGLTFSASLPPVISELTSSGPTVGDRAFAGLHGQFSFGLNALETKVGTVLHKQLLLAVGL